jgi:hypothetical protein
MTISTKSSVYVFLFDGWTARGGWAFFGMIAFTTALCLLSELIALFMAKLSDDTLVMKSAFVILFFILRGINYLQMLICMTFNIWLIITLVLAQGIFFFIAAIMRDKAMLKYISNTK